MIPWSAYAPRRARDPHAWLSAKGVTSRDELNAALRSLGIDPATFPEDIARQHLASLQTKEKPAPQECSGPAEAVQTELADDAPASPRKIRKKGPLLNPPT